MMDLPVPGSPRVALGGAGAGAGGACPLPRSDALGGPAVPCPGWERVPASSARKGGLCLPGAAGCVPLVPVGGQVWCV